uniref:G-protein coupled receptors family 1 profile domain-containing protein n=1 Tax=Capra hircus TaxID=9925 RepID=A0A452E4M6_CAPHI
MDFLLSFRFSKGSAVIKITWDHSATTPSPPFSSFLLAMGANATLLVTIRLEASLHEPMYCLLSLLSLLDVVLCLTVIPKVLAIFWFDNKAISFSGCFLQMFIMNSFLTMESSRAAIFVVARNGLLTMPIPILSSRLRYCAENIIKNCICTNLSVSKPSCDDINLQSAWTLLGSDLILIILSYSCILKAVLKIKVEGAAAKALSTCGSHFILILFFSTVLLVLVITNLARKRIPPDVPILLNILHHLIPPALNPIVYGVRTKEIKQGIQKLLRRL